MRGNRSCLVHEEEGVKIIWHGRAVIPKPDFGPKVHLSAIDLEAEILLSPTKPAPA